MAKSELHKFSAVAEKLKISQAHVRVICQLILSEVVTALNDGVLRSGIDRFVHLVHGIEVKEEEQAANHNGSTTFKHLIDEAK